MPFGLCNAPATFQRCMVAIFQDMIESSMEVFMDDFSVYGDSFDQCLVNLERMLKRCVETKLMLNWEKCHFMVTEGIVLGHKISRVGIETWTKLFLRSSNLFQSTPPFSAFDRPNSSTAIVAVAAAAALLHRPTCRRRRPAPPIATGKSSTAVVRSRVLERGFDRGFLHRGRSIEGFYSSQTYYII
ncbi:hypothetical protein E3N88_25434 [Mikania micrantha]|uniref:Reverse transcriptase domain-containing protein n=1 Tax=Mikania micrantha TaxID=192012 RepID=A0A5N6N657_9ASTR|nr:hypothetical protein E3N88_25434 [Mikania micrantha]